MKEKGEEEEEKEKEEEDEEEDEVLRHRRDRGGSDGGGGEGEERSLNVKRVTRMERTNRHSVLRPRYTANMAAEGRIGGGQPRCQPMSS